MENLISIERKSALSSLLIKELNFVVIIKRLASTNGEVLCIRSKKNHGLPVQYPQYRCYCPC